MGLLSKFRRRKRQPRRDGATSIPELQRYAGYRDDDLAVFDRFVVRDPVPTPGFVTDAFGVKTRVDFLPEGVDRLSGRVIGLPVPDDGIHAEVVEYIALYQSVAAAGASYVAMEIGAGWGPWLVSGAVAARHAGIEDIRLYGIEGDAEHLDFARQHLRDNGFDPDAHVLLHAAVGAERGRARWYGAQQAARDQYGLRPVRDRSEADVEYVGAIGGSEERATEIDILPVADLLEREAHWDLIHIDIQGWEAEVCAAAIEALTERARYVVVGTHSRELDGKILRTFWQAGWILEHEKPTRFAFNADAPALENMTSHDGIQVWRNPKR